MAKYEELRGALKTGDIVLFSGNSFISRLIRLATRSDWSHVGMILKFHGYDSIFLWESTGMNNVRDAFTGRRTSGVQVTLLSERIARYDGKCAIRRIENFIISPEQIGHLNRLRREIKNRPYEQSKKELIKSAIDTFGTANKEDLSSLFCSELVAESWQRLGILSEDKSSNEYLPSDFSEDSEDLRYAQGAALGGASLSHEVVVE